MMSIGLKETYHGIKNALLDIVAAENEKPLAKVKAKSLCRKFENFEYAVLAILWNHLLQRMNTVSESLQSKNSDLLVSVVLLNSLKAFIIEVRNDLFYN